MFLAEMSAAPFGERGEWLQIAIADASDALIGDIGLFTSVSGAEAELGITLAREAQGRGLAEEAGRTLIDGLRAHTDARRLVAITDTRNAPSARLLRRLGMALEAELPAEFQGEPCTEWHFALEL
jgi:RimJ/RimL family protein N-acetyltransferase